MARRRRAVAVEDPTDDIIEEYQRRLTAPVVPQTWKWAPQATGPTWQVIGGRWALPELTLGWEVLGWCGRWLQQAAQVPWMFTDEQARWLLWWFAVDETGRFLFRDGVLQRLKGWGKDPVGACLCIVEMVGPARFSHFDDDGLPVGRDVETAWVQTAAVSQKQTKNTTLLFPALVTPEAKAVFGIQIGRQLVHALGDERLIEAVTSSPETLQGARATFVLRNETHHWMKGNDGHEMDRVIDGNATKSADGSARALSITNAWDPSQDSVAQRAREAYDAGQSGKSAVTGILYDSLEAHPNAPLTIEAGPEVVRSIKGDSVWLNEERIVQAIVDPRNPASRSRRYWYNQPIAAEDAWIRPHEWAACISGDRLQPGDAIALGFDGSLTEDSTALIACRLSDGLVQALGIWEKPTGGQNDGWRLDEDVVDSVMEGARARYQVVALFGDYYPLEGLQDRWRDRFGARLRAKASAKHATAFDMRFRTKEFTVGCERVEREIRSGDLLAAPDEPNGHLQYTLGQHVRNARRRPNAFGEGIGKESKDSPRKIDGAVTIVLARMARHAALAAGGGGSYQAPRRVR